MPCKVHAALSLLLSASYVLALQLLHSICSFSAVDKLEKPKVFFTKPGDSNVEFDISVVEYAPHAAYIGQKEYEKLNNKTEPQLFPS